MTESFDSFYGVLFIVFLVFLLALVLLYRTLRTSQSKTTFQVISWNVLLSLCLLSSIMMIGETYYRFFVDETDSFSINKVSQRWMERYYQLNNFNVRDNEMYAYKKASGKKRVTIIGDSFTAGHGIKNVESRFGNLLRSKNEGVEVHVLASNGANSMHELGTLVDLAQKGYEFDYIVLAYCLNDIDYLLDETKEVYKRMGAFKSRLGVLGRESYFINTLFFRWFAFTDPDFMKYSHFVKEAYDGSRWEEQKETLKKIKRFSRTVNARLITVTFPFLQENKDEYSFRSIHEKLDEFWLDERVEHLDLLDTFEPYLGEDLTVNAYDAHPNELANELAADEIDRFLNKIIK